MHVFYKLFLIVLVSYKPKIGQQTIFSTVKAALIIIFILTINHITIYEGHSSDKPT